MTNFTEFAQPWRDYLKGFHIFGGLYHVGGRSSPSYLIDTGDGLLLLDTGSPKSAFCIFQNFADFGYNPRDVRWIIHSHGHIDHIGLSRMFMEMNHAETFIGRDDLDIVNGKLDLTWAKELGIRYEEPFEPDHLLDDGDELTFGNVTIKCLSTPGHTPGVMSYFFNLTENGQTLRAGTFGGAGFNSMKKEFLDRYDLSYDCREKFLDNFPKLHKEKVDIFFGNHLGSFHFREKLDKIAAGAKSNPFIDPGEWENYLNKTEADFREFLKNDR